MPAREFNLIAYAAITWHNDRASPGLEPGLADHRNQAARTVMLPTAPPRQAPFHCHNSRLYTHTEAVSMCHFSNSTALKHILWHCTQQWTVERSLNWSELFWLLISSDMPSSKTIRLETDRNFLSVSSFNKVNCYFQHMSTTELLYSLVTLHLMPCDTDLTIPTVEMLWILTSNSDVMQCLVSQPCQVTVHPCLLQTEVHS